ncbi:hypothetical protein [Lactiplantibacillus plantarum]|uniref:Lipoprotein n=2 Tax=Lactiplantibacillus plantarum TaxID=1590 RepID=A0A162EN22_LACPN|nr:hypothetical protein [Lactiplantibacillus plantarum]KZU93000.1 lipoprotein precursor [Lactiplantibacillus plantarum]MCW0154077.1 hypothetical protein [Lactiplantibacillus plantarum]MDG6770230.1 hypothetical protein [Lactiplantibacillus plantarum]QSE56702.1 hypothetical protein JWR92_07505 [Lactiplantibacillus plantarum]QXN31530.1 hypothetical protein KVG02_12800 [Lactiplantibacillus plantarum subsp. plantarum]
MEMKKIWKCIGLVSLLGLTMIVLVSCGSKKIISTSDSDYSSSISKGLDAVAEDKFNKALTYFDNALTQKPKDKKAQAYRDQTQAYVDTQSQLKAGEVKKAVETVTTGVKVTNGAKSLDDKLSGLGENRKG